MELLEQLGNDLRPEETLKQKAEREISKSCNPDSKFFEIQVNAYMLGYQDAQIDQLKKELS